jgi:DNA-directed RNA polymerase specialized sigma24 family protein
LKSLPKESRNHAKDFVVMDPTTAAGRAAVATGSSFADNQATEAAERALLALVSIGDRSAMGQLYIRYFARLAKFFQNMTARTDLVEELINDTMFEVWKEGESIGDNASVLLAIMRLAYSRVRKHLAEVDEPYSQERAVLHLVYAEGCSRRETADIMKIACNYVDVLLRDARASAKSGRFDHDNVLA